MASATMRAFRTVKSSPIMPRQPSVPNLILSMHCEYTRSAEAAKELHLHANCDALRKRLQEPRQLAAFERFNDLPDILGALAGTDQERVCGFHHHQITDSDGGDKLVRAPQEIPLRVERFPWPVENVLTVVTCHQLVNRSPRAYVAPADVRGNDKNGSFATAFGTRSFFEDGVIHRYVLQASVDPLQLRRVTSPRDVLCKLLHGLVRRWQKPPEGLQKCRNAPEEHSGIPLIHSGRQVFLGLQKLRFFGETSNREDSKAAPRNRRFPAFDVAEAGVRPRRRDSEHRHSAGLPDNLQCHANDLPESSRFGNVVVGREHRHQGLTPCYLPYVDGGKRDRRRSISSERFCQH